MVHIVLTLTLLVLTCTCSVSSSLISDFHALISLKLGFHSSNYAIATWDSSKPTALCSWSGIKCFNNRVTHLNLSNMALYGSISPAISRLDKLIELSIDGNNFTGEIKIENMSSLRFVNISNNQFNGNLDWNYSSLGNVQVLDAYNNNFSAYLPTGLLSLKNLKYLELGGNYFHGRIPKSYGNLMELEYLSLDGNDLEGNIPKELGNLTNLKQIRLGSYNVYNGGIPREFGKLVNLVHMDISSCELDGTIPLELGNLTSLDTLFLHMNRLSGPIPKELGNLTNLVNLDLSVNALTEEIPYEFVNLKQIKLLKLFMNRLHGSIPDFISDYSELETLGLWMNNFTGTIPRNLGANQKIQDLDLSSNKLTGTIPKHLCASKQLRILILRINFLFGSIPDDLGECSSLVRVRLGQNYFDGGIPGGLIYLPEINFLELHNNMLSGILSENRKSSSSNQTKLSQINLSNNQLSGLLPSSLSTFSSLQILYLNGNRFSGQIPPSIGELHQVVKLDLRGNALTGKIPHEIGKCLHLNYLDLSQNNLSGSIPDEISNIRILSYFNVSRNNLTESIPQSIGSIRSLTTIDFSFNNLSGKIPESGQFSFFNASSFVGNPQLCGAILNNPCNLTTITNQRTKSHNGFKLMLALVLFVCSIVFATAVIKAKPFKRIGSNSWKMTAFQKVDFTVSDILECVKDGNVIGRGGAGIVYHGKMANGVEIAVKKLVGFHGVNNSHDHGFKAEIQTLGNIRHRNIVRLIAFCSNKDTNFLVYEYMRNGSLGEALMNGKKGGFLSWNLRYKIAIDAAKGLCYLHHDCSPLIVHRDVKSNNILLDSSFEAHVADFGLAKFLVDGGASQCMSAIAGSYGYIAPEYAYTLRVDEKSDVYSFGVVLLELVTGRRPVGEFGEGVDIVQWVRCSTNCRREDVTRIIDPRITVAPKDEAMHLFFVAMLCVQENSVERPTMREVVQMLSEFPRSSPELQSSSSAISHQPPQRHHQNGKNPDEKIRPDLLI
ncbi:hypothetical protein ABFS82_02G074100 [Erythranthe guttata]|uniref:non-specific serine/threonine protein kinase n=1 Tax=Erythranthe guttata TaxID=4155 RepID=A0A022QJ09_ERYGU|nr:PREDICTED: leucine-rich repeat receptor-like serine/threonine-protein kinase BAM3 [Erythranthe guttata]EYU26470.1 hypothetical protein MIMGU_mgv1a019834mg [Erythranthe guttata]|eukprot:XP_012850402.1 PREDICTED: leucine-rich repeat receptor-like serine/threonine-protein kinase BAM3 [Erythranthe guttata]